MTTVEDQIRVRIPTKLVRENGTAMVELNAYQGEEKKLLEQALGQDEKKAGEARQTLRGYCIYLPQVAAHLTRDLSLDEVRMLTQQAIDATQEPDYFSQTLSLALQPEEQQAFRQTAIASLREGEGYLTEDNPNKKAATNGQIVKILQVLGFSTYSQEQLKYMTSQVS